MRQLLLAALFLTCPVAMAAEEEERLKKALKAPVSFAWQGIEIRQAAVELFAGSGVPCLVWPAAGKQERSHTWTATLNNTSREHILRIIEGIGRWKSHPVGGVVILADAQVELAAVLADDGFRRALAAEALRRAAESTRASELLALARLAAEIRARTGPPAEAPLRWVWLLPETLSTAADNPLSPPAPTEAQRAEIEALVGQLGDRGYAARAKAHERLAALGRLAGARLAEAAGGADPEVAARCRELLARIDRSAGLDWVVLEVASAEAGKLRLRRLEGPALPAGRTLVARAFGNPSREVKLAAGPGADEAALVEGALGAGERVCLVVRR